MAATVPLVWADLRTSAFGPDLCSTLPSSYIVERLGHLPDLLRAVQRCRPWAVCLEYDVEYSQGLAGLAELRDRHPSLPLVVLAEQKAPALRTFALQQNVWDYLVKPVSVRRLCDCLTSIGKASASANGSPAPVSPPLTHDSAKLPCSARTLAPALSYVASNFPDKLRLMTVAKLCDLSPFQFSRNFKKQEGLTFRDFVVQTRIRRAAELMRQSKVSVTEAAFVVGFNDLSYFSRMFRRQFGMPPSQYRRANADVNQMLLFPATDPRTR
jgi:AraC-like DNA-binding protein